MEIWSDVTIAGRQTNERRTRKDRATQPKDHVVVVVVVVDHVVVVVVVVIVVALRLVKS